MKRILLTVLFSIVFATIFFAYLFYATTDSLDGYTKHLYKPIFLIFVANTICISISLNMLNNKAYKLFIKKKARSISFLFLFILNIIVTAIFSYISIICYYRFIDNQSVLNAVNKNIVLLLNYIILFIAFLIIYSVISFFLYSYRKFSVLQVEMISLQQKQLLLQLEALEQQLSPHFLFNNLNTISSLIYTDIKIADQYIRNFAAVYSKFSNTNTNVLTKLNDEIDFINEYSYLLKTRFNESIEININVADHHLTSYILPLSLQLLVENAIKHNAFNDDNPLKIEIFSENNMLIIKNNLLLNKTKVKSHKVGHNNLIKRYHIFTRRKPVFKQENNSYIAKVPLIKCKEND